jgi:hypothetical protein
MTETMIRIRTITTDRQCIQRRRTIHLTVNSKSYSSNHHNPYKGSEETEISLQKLISKSCTSPGSDIGMTIVEATGPVKSIIFLCLFHLFSQITAAFLTGKAQSLPYLTETQ